MVSVLRNSVKTAVTRVNSKPMHTADKYALLSKREVKIAGYWPSSFFFCVLMDRDKVEVHENAKKERGQYPAILTEQAWSIKDLLDMNMFETYFVLRLKYSV